MTRRTNVIMYLVLLALVPGIIAQGYFFGLGVLINLALALTFAALIEWLVGRVSTAPTLSDGSALVTASLIALALPPGTSPGLILLGVAVGLVLGKHLYGGLGANPFNPAMVGYAVLLISFPAQLAAWPAPDAVADAMTSATPLDAFKHRLGLTVADFAAANTATAWPWINLGFALGGLTLAARRIIDWRIPLAVLASLGILASFGYDAGSSTSLGAPTFHFTHGAVMLGAFFIATDPVTCPATARGRVLFGVLVGVLIYVIRSWAAFPDGVAFAVLLGNAAAPLIDQYLPERRARHA